MPVARALTLAALLASTLAASRSASRSASRPASRTETPATLPRVPRDRGRAANGSVRELSRLPHDLHVTQSSVLLERGVATWRLRCFADDLQKGLRDFAARPAFELATDRAADSLFTAYFNAKVLLRADGQLLRATLVSRKRDVDALGDTVQIYVMRLDAGKQPTKLSVTNSLLFEQFPTEQNIVVLVAMPAAQRRAMYFVPSDGEARIVTVSP